MLRNFVCPGPEGRGMETPENLEPWPVLTSASSVNLYHQLDLGTLS